MAIDLIKRITLFVSLCLVQALVLNQIHLFDCATPLLYVYFTISLSPHTSKWAGILWSFLIGLVADTFANTPGVAAASMTAVGAFQPYFFRLVVSQEVQDDVRPYMYSMGPMKYGVYAFTLICCHCLMFFSFELFSFFNLLQWVLCVLGSTAVTFVLVLTLEIVRRQ